MTELRLTRAIPADLPFIMATERQDGYDALVGRWSEDRHRTGLGDDTHAYFGGVHKDELSMSILRPEWEAKNRAAPPPAT